MNLKPGPKPKKPSPFIGSGEPPDDPQPLEEQPSRWPRAVHLLDGRRLEVTGEFEETIGSKGMAALTFRAGAQYGRVTIPAHAILLIELGQAGELAL